MARELNYVDFEHACIAQALRRAARSVTRRYEATLRPLGLTMGQFTTLASLARPKPVPLMVLAEQLGMDRTTLTRDLAPLERRGLVASTSSPDDGRVRAIALTSAGRELLELATPLWRDAQAESVRRLGGADWGAIREQIDLLSR